MPENDLLNAEESPQVDDPKPDESDFLIVCWFLGDLVLAVSILIGLIRGVPRDFYFLPLPLMVGSFMFKAGVRSTYRHMGRNLANSEPSEKNDLDRMAKGFAPMPIIMKMATIIFPLIVAFLALTMDVP